MIIDCFPFFNEVDVLDIRLHELAEVVDRWVIIEALETFGGDKRDLVLASLLSTRFAEFKDRIRYVVAEPLQPKCTDRTTGRLREAHLRDQMMPMILREAQSGDDIVIISDCDEIPRATALRPDIRAIHRLKQHSYYYSVNWLVDYGNDWASRARVGTAQNLIDAGGVMGFRKHASDPMPVIEDGGWHFGYFGGESSITEKVKALQPFLSEYRMFGREQLNRDMAEGRDLHHRRCELPERFEWRPSNDPALPAYFLNNRDKFTHFTMEEVAA